MKKTVTTSTVGRRNKQQILKDWARPAPASVTSSPVSIIGGNFDAGNIPGCGGQEAIYEDGEYDGGGTYRVPLSKENYYWKPVDTDIQYYTSVYFDGFAAQSGVHYTVEDTYKVVPTDPGLLTSSSIVEAIVVV